MGTKLYYLNNVQITSGAAQKLGFPDNIFYVTPGLSLDCDESLTKDVNVAFVEGNDCQYLDIYTPDIMDIGMEHNVYHEKHGSLVRYISSDNHSLYMPSYHGTYYRDDGHQYYTTYSWSMSTSECFLWQHSRYYESRYGITNRWIICKFRPLLKGNTLRYGTFQEMDRYFRDSKHDGITDPQYFITNYPQYFWTYVNNDEFSSVRVDLVSPKVLSYPSKDNHILTGGIKSACALEALNALKANTNNVQNIFSIIDIAKALLQPNRLPSLLKALPKRGAKSLSADAWLKYRYVYKTTLSDIEEMTRFIIQGLDHSNTITLRGGLSTPAGTCRVRISAKTGDLSQFAYLQEYGIAPDLYNIWDSIPFSFVVDWFTGIGDFAQQISDRQWAMNYDIVSCTTSWKWTDSIQTTLGPVPFTHYQRFVTSTAPPFVPYSSDTVSDKTLIKRLVDGVALLLGK